MLISFFEASSSWFLIVNQETLLILQPLKVVAEKRDEYNDPGLGICGTDRVERQEGKEIKGTSEHKVEIVEMRVKLEKKEEPKWEKPNWK